MRREILIATILIGGNESLTAWWSCTVVHKGIRKLFKRGPAKVRPAHRYLSVRRRRHVDPLAFVRVVYYYYYYIYGCKIFRNNYVICAHPSSLFPGHRQPPWLSASRERSFITLLRLFCIQYYMMYI